VRTETITLYTYEELSEEAKKEARAWYRRASEGDNFFAECVIEDAVECGRILGISINTRKNSIEPAVYWSGFWSQGDGASFEGSWRYAKGSTKAIRKHAPSDTTLHGIADRLAYAAKKTFYMVSAEVACATSHYSHSGCMQVEVRMEINAHNEEVEEEITQALRDFADWIYRQLEKGYEYQNSDEVVAENIIANEYEFTENGNRH
jgi:hypothetical protein